MCQYKRQEGVAYNVVCKIGIEVDKAHPFFLLLRSGVKQRLRAVLFTLVNRIPASFCRCSDVLSLDVTPSSCRMAAPGNGKEQLTVCSETNGMDRLHKKGSKFEGYMVY